MHKILLSAEARQGEKRACLAQQTSPSLISKVISVVLLSQRIFIIMTILYMEGLK